MFNKKLKEDIEEILENVRLRHISDKENENQNNCIKKLITKVLKRQCEESGHKWKKGIKHESDYFSSTLAASQAAQGQGLHDIANKMQPHEGRQVGPQYQEPPRPFITIDFEQVCSHCGEVETISHDDYHKEQKEKDINELDQKIEEDRKKLKKLKEGK